MTNRALTDLIAAGPPINASSAVTYMALAKVLAIAAFVLAVGLAIYVAVEYRQVIKNGQDAVQQLSDQNGSTDPASFSRDLKILIAEYRALKIEKPIPISNALCNFSSSMVMEERRVVLPIYFNKNGDGDRPDVTERIAQLQACIASAPANKIQRMTVQAYADRIGLPNDNAELIRKRAATVKAELEKKFEQTVEIVRADIDSTCFVSDFDARPTGPDENPTCRRVIVTVTYAE